MTQHILVTAIGSDRTGLVRRVTKTLLDCGCNISESRLATMGSHFVMLIMVSGNWHSMSKLEAELDAVASELSLQIAVHKTDATAQRSNQLPYAVDLVCLDQPGIVNTLAAFFSTRDIAIAEMTSKRYAAAHTGAQMFNLQMIISVPDSTHIATLREEFMELCDHYNLDAILEPVKN